MSTTPKRRRFTLTQRVVWAVTATVALFTGLLSMLAYFAMHAQEDDLTDDMLRREVQQLINLTLKPGLMPVGALQASPGLTAYLTRGNEGMATLPIELKSLAPGLYQLTPEGHIWHVAVVDSEDGRLCIVLDATASEERVFHFGYTLLALWILCVAAAALIARGVAAIAVGPIVDATRSIARWAPDRPAGQAPPLDEAGVLMETFNRFRDRVDETVAREREFAANLDHEIRTPLTTIRTDAELIALEAALAPDEQQRIDRIIASVDDIVATTESALSSSAGRAEATAAIALRECLQTVCDALADRAAQRDLRIEIAVGDGSSLVADRQALLTVCRNIVRNAIEHAAPATLRIEGDARGLTFSDDGPGIAPAALPHVFERFTRAAAPMRAMRGRHHDAAWAWRSPDGCATCRAGGSRCARRSTTAAAPPSPSSSKPCCNGIFTSWPRPRHARSHSVAAMIDGLVAEPQGVVAAAPRERAMALGDYAAVHLGLVPALLVAAAWIVQHSPLDMALANIFFDPVGAVFPWRDSSWLDVVGHHAARGLPIVVAAVAIAGWAMAYAITPLRPWRTILLTLGGAMLIGPLLINVMKSLTSQHCPSDILELGGIVSYAVDRAAPFWAATRQSAGHCLPSGHAGGGFALLSLYFAGWAAARPAWRWGGLAIGITAGLGFSVVRMMQGAHFASATVWSAALDWTVCALLFAPLLCRRAPPSQ